MNLSEFEERYPDSSFLEQTKQAIRLSNGLEEGTEHESVWFCLECEEELTDDECECQAEEDDSEPWL